MILLQEGDEFLETDRIFSVMSASLKKTLFEVVKE
jgi:hypothetical protein